MNPTNNNRYPKLPLTQPMSPSSVKSGGSQGSDFTFYGTLPNSNSTPPKEDYPHASAPNPAVDVPSSSVAQVPSVISGSVGWITAKPKPSPKGAQSPERDTASVTSGVKRKIDLPTPVIATEEPSSKRQRKPSSSSSILPPSHSSSSSSVLPPSNPPSVTGIKFGNYSTKRSSHLKSGNLYQKLTLNHQKYPINNHKAPPVSREDYKLTQDSTLESLAHIPEKTKKIVLCEGANLETVKLIPPQVRGIKVEGEVAPEAMVALPKTIKYVIIGNGASAKAIAAIPDSVEVISIIASSPEIAVKVIPSHIKIALLSSKLKDSVIYAIPAGNIQEYILDRDFLQRFTGLLSQFFTPTVKFTFNK